jgi:hypothetical protein
VSASLPSHLLPSSSNSIPAIFSNRLVAEHFEAFSGLLEEVGEVPADDDVKHSVCQVSIMGEQDPTGRAMDPRVGQEGRHENIKIVDGQSCADATCELLNPMLSARVQEALAMPCRGSTLCSSSRNALLNPVVTCSPQQAGNGFLTCSPASPPPPLDLRAVPPARPAPLSWPSWPSSALGLIAAWTQTAGELF